MFDGHKSFGEKKWRSSSNSQCAKIKFIICQSPFDSCPAKWSMNLETLKIHWIHEPQLNGYAYVYQRSGPADEETAGDHTPVTSWIYWLHDSWDLTSRCFHPSCGIPKTPVAAGAGIGIGSHVLSSSQRPHDHVEANRTTAYVVHTREPQTSWASPQIRSQLAWELILSSVEWTTISPTICDNVPWWPYRFSMGVRTALDLAGDQLSGSDPSDRSSCLPQLRIGEVEYM